MKRLVVAVVVLAFVGLTFSVQAADKPAKAADPTGTWKWTVNFGGQEREMTLNLKMEKGKLTGEMVRADQKTPIEEATCKDGTISFKVTRERNGQKFTSKYTAKVTGDTLKGKMEFEREGQTQSRDWEAKKSKS